MPLPIILGIAAVVLKEILREEDTDDVDLGDIFDIFDL